MYDVLSCEMHLSNDKLLHFRNITLQHLSLATTKAFSISSKGLCWCQGQRSPQKKRIKPSKPNLTPSMKGGVFGRDPHNHQRVRHALTSGQARNRRHHPRNAISVMVLTRTFAKLLHTNNKSTSSGHLRFHQQRLSAQGSACWRQF